jgi:hypothetical protein
MASSLRLSNNGLSKLAASASSAATTITLISGDGAKFPALSAGQFFPLTIVRASDGAIEIVKVTARSTDTLTITRAQEGTTALNFVAGDRVEHRLTAGTVSDEFARVEGVADDAQSDANQALSNAAAAQATANAALPRSGGTMTGNITFASGQQFPGAASTGKAIAMTIVFGG